MDDTSLISEIPGAAPPKLPLKTRLAIAAENRLASLAWPITAGLCGSAITCEVARETPADLNGFIRVALRLDDQPAALFMARPLYQGLAGLIDRETLTEDLDGRVKALLLESGLAADLEQLENALGWRVAFEQVHPALDRKAADLFWLNVTLADGAGGLLGLSLPPDHADRLARHLDTDKPTDSENKLPLPLQVTVSLRTGSTVLGLADLKSLRPGDIVLMDHSLFGAGKIAAVGGHGNWLFDADLGEDGVTLASARRAPHSQDRDLWLMDDLDRDQAGDETTDLDSGDELADPPSLDDLPIKLLFEIGQIEVSLGDLAELGPGHVFDLHRDLQKSVDIRAAGKKIGKGEIVEIDGRIGVRIGSLFDHA